MYSLRMTNLFQKVRESKSKSKSKSKSQDQEQAAGSMLVASLRRYITRTAKAKRRQTLLGPADEAREACLYVSQRRLLPLRKIGEAATTGDEAGFVPGLRPGWA